MSIVGEPVAESWLRHLGSVVPPDQLVAVAALGAADPEWQRQRAASYWQRIALLQLAHEPELRRLAREVVAGDAPRVLEIGCGPGVLARLLLREGAATVDGLERDEAPLALWGQLPVPSSPSALRFQAGRLAGPYPFDDDAFDLVWLSGYWFATAVPELRRVLRPGGRVVVTTSGVAPYVTYAFDPALEARLHAAFRRGYDELHSRAADYLRARTLAGRLDADPRCTRLSLRSHLVERTAPLPPAMAEYLRQNFALFIGGLLREQASSADWERVSRLYTPGPAWLFARADLHVVQSMVVAHVALEPDAAGRGPEPEPFRRPAAGR